MFILKWNERWQHKCNTNWDNQILKKVPERVCSGIYLYKISAFWVKYFSFNLHLKIKHELLFVTFSHWRQKMKSSNFAIFFNKNGNCSSQQAMYMVFLVADKTFLANWFNLTKKSQKTIFYRLKIEEN